MRWSCSIHLIYIAILILIFQPVLEVAIPAISYYDEILALLFLGAYLLHILKSGKISKSVLKLFLVWSIFAVIGLIGNEKSQSGQPLFLILIDILANTKLFMVSIPLFSCSLTTKERKKVADWLAVTIRLLILLMFVCAFISIFIDIGMSGEVRYGIKSYRFVFANPAGLNTYFYSFMVVFSATLFKDGKLRPKSNLYMVMATITWILTLRSRAIAFACIYVLIYVIILRFSSNRKLKFKFKWYYVPPILMVAFLIGWPTFEEYFLLNSRQARYVLLRGAISIAADYFPFGAGFATYGTAASIAQYSTIYSRYGLANVWGISASSAYFVMDQYWCGILGQFGIIGLLIMGYMIFALYKEVLLRSYESKSTLLASLTFIYTSLLASISAASYIQASVFISVLVIFALTAPPAQRSEK